MERSELLTSVMQRIGNIKRLSQGQQYRCSKGETFSSAQLTVLFAIKRYGPISSHSLAEKLAMTPGGISQLLDTLVTSELVTKDTSDTDRRSFTLRVSDKGTRLAQHVWDKHYAMLEQTTAEFSDDELTMFIAMLDKIARSLEPQSEKHKEGA